MRDDIQEHRFDAGDVTLNYAEGPATGPALVMLHGGSARWQAFDAIIPDLAARWHLYLPDFRGHGGSGRTSGRYRLADYSADICAFLGACVPAPAFLFGHSLGGIVALLVAARCPDRVGAVIVGDAPLDKTTWGALLEPGRERLRAWRDLAGGGVPLEEIVEALKNAPQEEPSGQPGSLRWRDALGEDHPVFPWLAENLYWHDPDMLAMLLDDFERVAAGYDMQTVLPAIRRPVLLLQADLAVGGIMGDAEVRQALDLLPQGTHVQLTGLSHVFHNERKKPVVQAIGRFLALVA